MTEDALVFLCDEAACREDPMFYEIFAIDDRWAIIRAILKAVEVADTSIQPPADHPMTKETDQ